MTQTEGHARPGIAAPDEDPNAAGAFSSPPCFLHELDPSYLGYLGREEVSALLRDLLAVQWVGTVLETAWLRAMLRRHLARLGLARLGAAPSPKPGRPDDAPRSIGGPAAPADDGVDRLAGRLREALPRLRDDALRHDLAELLRIMERDMRRQRARHELA